MNDTVSVNRETEKPSEFPGDRRRVLMIAYRFPPINFTDVIRPSQFVKHLPDFGYAPLVLTQEGFSECAEDPNLMRELEGRCEVIRVRPVSFGPVGRWISGLLRFLDRVFGSVLGKDRVVSSPFQKVWNKVWRQREFATLALWAAFRAKRRIGYDLVWATGPPWGTLHLGYAVSRLTKTPLVTDVRDPWTYTEGFLESPNAEREKVWERKVLNQSARIVYTSPLTTRIMKEQFPPEIADRMVTITNGFSKEPEPEPSRTPRGEKCVFSYVGNLFRFRDPTVLFEALRILCEDSEAADSILLRFIGRMAGYEEKIPEYGISDQVEIVGLVSMEKSLEYMRQTDVLVLLQTISGVGSDVVGGKAYEYLATRKPILGVVDEEGGDAWLLNESGGGKVVGNSDPKRVADGMIDYWRLWKEDRLAETTAGIDLARFSRRHLTSELASLFDSILAPSEGSLSGRKHA